MLHRLVAVHSRAIFLLIAKGNEPDALTGLGVRIVRVLCTTLPEYGHFHPLVPLARALVGAGHQVAFATADEFCPRAEAAGFTAFAAGLGFRDQQQTACQRYPEAALPPGEERFVSFVPKMLAGVAAPARAADLVPLVERWRPDVVVHGEAEFAGPVAAEATGIPYAAQSVGILRPLEMLRLAGTELAPLCAEWGVDVGPFGGLFRYLYFDVCPPSLQDPRIAEVTVAHAVDAEGKPLALRQPPGGAARPAAEQAYEAAGGEALPAWVADLSPDPVVYVTLGTLNRDPGVYGIILEGLRDQLLNVIVTVGTDNDPAAFGPHPGNVHIERYIPQSLLLPHCDLVVNHGGSVLPVLGHGLPLLMIPQGGNEYQNATACVAVGAGRQLLRSQLTPEAVRREVAILLGEATYRAPARRIAKEIEAMPGPEEGVRLLEQLERERRPLVSGSAPAAAQEGR